MRLRRKVGKYEVGFSKKQQPDIHQNIGSNGWGDRRKDQQHAAHYHLYQRLLVEVFWEIMLNSRNKLLLGTIAIVLPMVLFYKMRYGIAVRLGETIEQKFTCGDQQPAQVVEGTPQDVNVFVEKYIFLDDSWEQYTAGKYTLRDFEYIAALSSRRPVMPFLGKGSSAFVGLPNTSESTGQPADKVVAFNFPLTDWENFDTAYKSCRDRLRIATLVHGSDYNCTKLASALKEKITMWGARSLDCLEARKLDVEYFENSSDCIVLHDFTGLHHGRSKLRWKHSTNATRNQQLWNTSDVLLRNEYSHIQQSSDMAPNPHFLVRSAECNTHVWGDVFDVLQYRAEKLCVRLERGRFQHKDEKQQLFAEYCVNNTIDELIKLRQTDASVPILLMHDLHEHGSQSTSISTAKPCKSIFPVSRLAEIVKLHVPNVPVYYSTECHVFDNCQGSACFFLDTAIFLQARHVVQLGGGSSSQEMRLPRIHAGRNTTVIEATSFNEMTCPFQISVFWCPNWFFAITRCCITLLIEKVHRLWERWIWELLLLKCEKAQTSVWEHLQPRDVAGVISQTSRNA